MHDPLNEKTTKLLTSKQSFAVSGVQFDTLPEHNLFKNVSKGPIFCDKRKFKRLNNQYGLNHMIRIKKKEILLTLLSFIPSNMNFQIIFMA